MLALSLMLLGTYYTQNYASTIGRSLVTYNKYDYVTSYSYLHVTAPSVTHLDFRPMVYIHAVMHISYIIILKLTSLVSKMRECFVFPYKKVHAYACMQYGNF